MTAEPGTTLPDGVRLPASVRVERIDLLRTRRPLIRPFRTAFGRQVDREVLLVRITTPSAQGWGECATPAAPVYSAEFTDAAALVLRDHLVPRLLATGAPLSAAEVAPRLAAIRGQRMAKAALEAAVLDVQLRTAGVSLAQALGAVVARIPVGISLGIPDGGIPALLEEVDAAREAGYQRVKVKVAPGFDVAALTAIRARFGPGLGLQVDANAGYDPDDADHLAALDGLDELGLTMIEQPFAPDRLRDHARLAARWRTPVCLDESITDPVRARDAVECGAAGVVNIKPGRIGGLLASVQVRDVCRERGIPVWCGGMLETGIGRAANVALAALEGFRFPGDLSASDRYWAEDLTEPFELVDGHLDVPDTPGIGRRPLPGRLDDAEVTTVAHRNGVITTRW